MPTVNPATPNEFQFHDTGIHISLVGGPERDHTFNPDTGVVKSYNADGVVEAELDLNGFKHQLENQLRHTGTTYEAQVFSDSLNTLDGDKIEAKFFDTNMNGQVDDGEIQVTLTGSTSKDDSGNSIYTQHVFVNQGNGFVSQ